MGTLAMNGFPWALAFLRSSHYISFEVLLSLVYYIVIKIVVIKLYFFTNQKGQDRALQIVIIVHNFHSTEFLYNCFRL